MSVGTSSSTFRKTTSSIHIQDLFCQPRPLDVAVVRKIKRSGEYIDWKSGDSSTSQCARNMILEACLDASSNGKRIYLDDAEKDYDIHVADPFLSRFFRVSRVFLLFIQSYCHRESGSKPRLSANFSNLARS